MSGPAPQLTVPASELGPQSRLNAGANGTIWALPDYRLPGDTGSLVFKQYRSAVSVSLPGLQSIVNARLRLADSRRAEFDKLTVWPLRAVVNESGAPVGVLMYLIDETFMERFALPSGRNERGPREVQHLIFDPAAARRLGAAVPDNHDLDTRYAICEQMAYAMSIMHGAGLVYGDLSARNVLYRLRPTPSILLVDCDAARVKGSSAVNKQQNSPDWDAPEGNRQTQDTDRYKLALFVLRCLAPGRGSSVNRDPAAADQMLDPQGRLLLRAALTSSPEHRPRAREWLQYLRQRIGLSQLPAHPTPPGQPVQHAQTTITTGWKRGEDGVWIRV